MALADFETSLTIFTREQYPVEWSQVIMNRDQALLELHPGDLRRHRENILADHEAALSILSPEKNPFEWAATHVNCGNVYVQSITGVTNHLENMRKGWEHYDQAL